MSHSTSGRSSKIRLPPVRRSPGCRTTARSIAASTSGTRVVVDLARSATATANRLRSTHAPGIGGQLGFDLVGRGGEDLEQRLRLLDLVTCAAGVAMSNPWLPANQTSSGVHQASYVVEVATADDRRPGTVGETVERPSASRRSRQGQLGPGDDRCEGAVVVGEHRDVRPASRRAARRSPTAERQLCRATHWSRSTLHRPSVVDRRRHARSATTTSAPCGRERVGVAGAVDADDEPEAAAPPASTPASASSTTAAPPGFDPEATRGLEEQRRVGLAGESELGRVDAVDAHVEQLGGAGRGEDRGAVLARRDDRRADARSGAACAHRARVDSNGSTPWTRTWARNASFLRFPSPHTVSRSGRVARRAAGQADARATRGSRLDAVVASAAVDVRGHSPRRRRGRTAHRSSRPAGAGSRRRVAFHAAAWTDAVRVTTPSVSKMMAASRGAGARRRSPDLEPSLTTSAVPPSRSGVARQAPVPTLPDLMQARISAIHGGPQWTGAWYR